MKKITAVNLLKFKSIHYIFQLI